MSTTHIEWATHTWNPVTGCTPISEGCKNCYAARFAKRLRGRCGYPADDPFRVTVHEDRIANPPKGKRVFVGSMTDLFHEDVPELALRYIWQAMGRTPDSNFLVLTKRPEQMRHMVYSWMDEGDFFADAWWGDDGVALGYALPNVWLGVSAENQYWMRDRVSCLGTTPAAHRFVSIEPMLGPVELSELHHSLDWVICGCESGPGARETKIEWVRSLRDQCVEAGVPFFLKQLRIGGKVVKMPELDGKVWDQMPEVLQ